MTKQELAEMVNKAERLAIKVHARTKGQGLEKIIFEAHVACC